MIWAFYVLVGLFALYILFPYFDKTFRNKKVVIHSAEEEDLSYRKEEIVNNLNDLEYDFQLKKITEPDYLQLKEKLTQDYINIKKRLDQISRNSGNNMQAALKTSNENLITSVPEAALRIEDLQYKIGLVTILKKLRFELKLGEVLCLLGPNGAGKSTLLKCLAGLLPYSGTRDIFGISNRKDSRIRQSLGYLGHETFLYNKLSARENLLFYSSLYGIQIDPAAILEEYRLTFAGEQLVETYSRGMRQRVALARALLNSPRLLLMDEPFTGLDQEACELLERRIRELRGKVSIVMAMHELDRAQSICDRFLILKNGKQLFFGSRNEIGNSLPEFFRTTTA